MGHLNGNLKLPKRIRSIAGKQKKNTPTAWKENMKSARDTHEN